MRNESHDPTKQQNAGRETLVPFSDTNIADPGGYGTAKNPNGGYALPFPGTPHDGSPQDQANSAAVVKQIGAFNNQQYAINNQPTLLDKLAFGLNMAGVSAGAGGAIGTAVAEAAGGGVAGGVAGGAAAGAVSGAAGSALSGQNIGKGALIGGLAGGAGGFLKSAAGGLGLGSQAAGAAGKIGSSLVGNAVGGALAPSRTNNVSDGISAGMNNLDTVGNNMAVGSNLQTGLGLGNTLLGGVGGLVGAYGGIQQGNANGNVLSLASGGTQTGTNTSYNGPNGYATINQGQVNTGLNGGLNTANQNLGNFAGQQAGIANSFNGIAPANVQNAINAQAGMDQNLPQGTQGQLQGQAGLQGAVQGSQFGLIGAGQNALNNPLTGNLQQAAQTQLGTAGQAFNTTYQNQLAGLNAQLAVPTQQAESQMADAQFGRGQLGTSGGALQTQAFAKGLGQAFLGNQQTAYNEALGAQNSAVNNAGVLNNAANSNLSTANGLLANAYGQFNNTSQLNANTANSIFNQNSVINQLGNQYGQQNIQNQTTANTLPAQLAGQYGQNANQAITGATGLNNIGLSGFNAALSAGTQQGNQYNNAIRNAAGVVSSGQSTNGLRSLGGYLNSAGSTNLLGGLGSAFSGALNGTNYSGVDPNMFGGNDAGYSGYTPDNGGASFDFGDYGFGTGP